MSTGKSAAKKAARSAEEAAAASNLRAQELDKRLREERQRANRLFIRQFRARQAGGFFDTSSTLG